MTSSDHVYCARQARTRDYDRYIAALAAPARCRDDLFAVLAFADEVARVRASVSEPAMGDIRLAWWRESIDEAVLETPKDHPVARGLAAAIRGHDLDARLFQGILNSHGRDLDDKPFKDLAELENYNAATSGNVGRIMLAVLGEFPEVVSETAARIGVAWDMIAALRDHRVQGRNWRGRGHALIAGPLSEDQILRRAEDLLIAARGDAARIPARARPALLTASISDLYLARLKAGAQDAKALYVSPMRRIARVIGRRLLGRY